MKEIEDIFQPLADAVSRGEIMNIGASDHRKISDFHLLWNLRAHSKNNPIGDQKLKGVSGMSLQLTQDHEEQLEKHNVMFVRNDATIPGRVWEGLHIQMRIDAMRPHMAGIEWGILRAEDGEFVVPDSFGASHLVPISPSIMLGAKNPNATISRDDVAKINEIALRSSMGYVFARDFSKCPYADELLPAATPKKYKQRKKK